MDQKLVARRVLWACAFAWLGTGCGHVVWAKSESASLAANPWLMWIRMFLALGVILALVMLSLRWLGQKGGVPAKGAIEVLAARQIAPGRFVQVIQVESKRYLIGVGEQVSLLADVTEDYPAWEPDHTGTRPQLQSTALVGSTSARLAEAMQRIRSQRPWDRVWQEKDGGHSDAATMGTLAEASKPSAFSEVLSEARARTDEEDGT
ncbi:MAG: flagellar biosynthetic protein FliO [Alicyclobacillus herbarius]|uniref:FliO/MopB family protein n=1 Tax=Alicyclobacillus herbarius TaxID=122960 RepID=UPI000685FB6F|nr:flagellar biosynthetic protein FliO [Alicyclobacillus herbarius]MCL6631989.1 flagellar biosynthetic protein FliO [Alicyclobacillus herbarius]